MDLSIGGEAREEGRVEIDAADFHVGQKSEAIRFFRV